MTVRTCFCECYFRLSCVSILQGKLLRKYLSRFSKRKNWARFKSVLPTRKGMRT